MAKDEKTWITVVKVLRPFDGDLDLTGIKNLNDVLDEGGAKAVSEIREMAKTEGALIKTRGEQVMSRRGSLRSRKRRKSTSSSWVRRRRAFRADCSETISSRRLST
jgi:hypothetical protein